MQLLLLAILKAAAQVAQDLLGLMVLSMGEAAAAAALEQTAGQEDQEAVDLAVLVPTAV